MRRKQSIGTIGRILAIMAVTLILANSAWGRVDKILYTFTGGADGNAPSALIFDGAGNLYGTTPGGGSGACQNLNYVGCGTVFELMRNADGTWTKKVLYEFMGGDDGAYPPAGLIFDGKGNLYGTTEGGGPGDCAIGPVPGCGGVFELMPNSDGTWTESVLYSFTDSQDGAFPLSGLILDGAGNLYGTAIDGGGATGLSPVLFKLSPSTGGWTESVLYNFAPFSSPGSLIFDSAGNLYGTNSTDDGYGNGGVFQLTPNPTGYWTRHLLHQFTGGNDGAMPATGLIFDSAGNLYGATSGGGAFGYGNVFRFTPNLKGGWSEHVLHQFTDGKQGGSPAAGLTRDAAGNLYGTTYHGGNLANCSGGCGVAFELTPTAHGWKESVLWSFADHPGAYPAAVPVLDTAGNLYGTTTGDGTTTVGSVFEITP
jgi:uncharacterized repeat protein (TIGR03803 family)